MSNTDPAIPASRGDLNDELMVVDTIPGMVCTFSVSGEIEILNRRTLEYFGKTLEEMRHWQDDEVIHSEDLPRVIRLFTQAITSGEPRELRSAS